jgi:5-(carboxyamino)imidazole ribonucleotide mutase
MKNQPLVSIIMGSQSDWQTMKYASKILKTFKVAHEIKIISAHRTPKRMFEFAENAEKRGIKIIIAGAGGAAHLPGMTASIANIPVLGVPIESKNLKGLDSLLSIVQMPSGIPVGSLAVGKAGADNAALLAISILGTMDSSLKKKYIQWRQKQTKLIAKSPK